MVQQHVQRGQGLLMLESPKHFFMDVNNSIAWSGDGGVERVGEQCRAEGEIEAALGANRISLA
eukprot:3851530-Alexandrium_andersonii.AAC.1